MTADCQKCGKPFTVGKRKFKHCSTACRSRKIETECAVCGSRMVHKRKDKRTYCSRKCMSIGYAKRMSGDGNPHFSDADRKTCEQCGGEYRSYTKRSRFCSVICRDAATVPSRGCRKDKNHDEIAAGLKRLGAVVVDTHEAGHGFPDLVVGMNGLWAMLEIKNPDNHYGRKLTKSQEKWHASAAGIGGPIATIRTLDEAKVALGIGAPF